jgi:hypothetical protein
MAAEANLNDHKNAFSQNRTSPEGTINVGF